MMQRLRVDAEMGRAASKYNFGPISAKPAVHGRLTSEPVTAVCGDIMTARAKFRIPSVPGVVIQPAGRLVG